MAQSYDGTMGIKDEHARVGVPSGGHFHPTPSSSFHTHSSGSGSPPTNPTSIDYQRAIDTLQRLRRCDPPIEFIALQFPSESAKLGSSGGSGWSEIKLPLHQVNEQLFLYGLKISDTLIIMPDMNTSSFSGTKPVVLTMTCDRRETNHFPAQFQLPPPSQSHSPSQSQSHLPPPPSLFSSPPANSVPRAFQPVSSHVAHPMVSSSSSTAAATTALPSSASSIHPTTSIGTTPIVPLLPNNLTRSVVQTNQVHVPGAVTNSSATTNNEAGGHLPPPPQQPSSVPAINSNASAMFATHSTPTYPMQSHPSQPSHLSLPVVPPSHHISPSPLQMYGGGPSINTMAYANPPLRNGPYPPHPHAQQQHPPHHPQHHLHHMGMYGYSQPPYPYPPYPPMPPSNPPASYIPPQHSHVGPSQAYPHASPNSMHLHDYRTSPPYYPSASHPSSSALLPPPPGSTTMGQPHSNVPLPHSHTHAHSLPVGHVSPQSSMPMTVASHAPSAVSPTVTYSSIVSVARIAPPQTAEMTPLKSKQNKPNTGTSCHQCKNTKPVKKLAFCSNQFNKRTKPEKRTCRKKYCDGCLRKFYNEGLPVNPSDWICASCLKRCLCAACVRHTHTKIVPSLSSSSSTTGQIKHDDDSVSMVSSVHPNAIQGETSHPHTDGDSTENDEDGEDEYQDEGDYDPNEDESVSPPSRLPDRCSTGATSDVPCSDADANLLVAAAALHQVADANSSVSEPILSSPSASPPSASAASANITNISPGMSVRKPVSSSDANSDMASVSATPLTSTGMVLPDHLPMAASNAPRHSSSSITRVRAHSNQELSSPSLTPSSVAPISASTSGPTNVPLSPLNFRRQTAGGPTSLMHHGANSDGTTSHPMDPVSAADLSDCSSSFTLSPLPSPNLALRTLSLSSGSSTPNSSTPNSSNQLGESASPGTSPFIRHRGISGSSFAKAPSPSLTRRVLESSRERTHPYTLTNLRTLSNVNIPTPTVTTPSENGTLAHGQQSRSVQLPSRSIATHSFVAAVPILRPLASSSPPSSTATAATPIPDDIHAHLLTSPSITHQQLNLVGLATNGSSRPIASPSTATPMTTTETNSDDKSKATDLHSKHDSEIPSPSNDTNANVDMAHGSM